MTKIEFTLKLYDKLSGLPRNEIEERIAFYVEMIEDRMEEGYSEAEAVAAVGDIDDIESQITAEVPFTKIVKERIKPKRQLKTWEIVLLAAGSPVWLALGIAAFAVIISLYAALWSVIVSLWAVFASFIAGSIGGIASGAVFILSGNAVSGLMMISAGLVLAGLSIFMFYISKVATKGAGKLTKKMALWIKSLFIKKEGAK